MKKTMIIILCAVCILLSGCTRVIRGPRDEIRLYTWESDMENGNTVSLTFHDSHATFSVINTDFTLTISGLCSLTDDSIVIIDENDGVGYSFDYTLTGESIALSYRGDTIELGKKVEE